MVYVTRQKPAFPKTSETGRLQVQREITYFITILTKNGSKYFCEHGIVAPMIEMLKEIAEKERFLVDVFCFMPDHLHLLVKGCDDQSDLNRFIKYFKQNTGYWFKQSHHKNLWHVSFYDHILRKEETFEDVVRYILNNPVRKGIVSDFKEYRFIGSFTMNIHNL